MKQVCSLFCKLDETSLQKKQLQMMEGFNMV